MILKNILNKIKNYGNFTEIHLVLSDKTESPTHLMFFNGKDYKLYYYDSYKAKKLCKKNKSLIIKNRKYFSYENKGKNNLFPSYTIYEQKGI